jgi:hypothetical protein
MKANKKMLMTLVLGLFFSCALFAQTFDKDQNKEDQIKQNWIDENQQEYIDQGGQPGQLIEVDSKNEKENWLIKTSDSETVPEFNSKEEKEAWFSENEQGSQGEEEWFTTKKIASPENAVEPKRAETREAVVVVPGDETFPVYVKTGNKSLDDDNYAQQKQDWINNNQAKYDKMSNPSPNKVMSVDEKKERKNVNQTNQK